MNKPGSSDTEAGSSTSKRPNSLDLLFINLPPVSPDLSNTDDPTSASTLHPPLGLMYLADSIQGKSFINSYKCVDFAICDFRGLTGGESLEAFVREELTRGGIEEPGVVAISLMFSSAYGFFDTVVRQVKKCWPNTVVIVGGMQASNTVSYLFGAHSEIGYVVCGEGEGAFVEFLEMISSGTEKEIQGLHSQSNIKRISETEFEQTAYTGDLEIDFTKFSNLLDMEKYTTETVLFSLSKTTASVRAFALMASRGCPYHCTFCASHTVHGRGMRHRSTQNIVDEIYWLNKEYGVTKIYLMDDNFVPKKKVLELFDTCSRIEIDNFEIVIQNMSINATDTEIVDAVAAAGINNIAFAIESGSELTQKRIKKRVKLDKAVDLVKYSRGKGLNVRCFYIIGFPEETVVEMEETFEFARTLGADWSTFSVASPIPGSEMYYEFIKLGYIEDGPSAWSAATLRDRIFDTKEIGAEDIKELAYRANLSVNFINNTYLVNRDYENAEVVMSNFAKQFDFHIFAHDCLRRIYKGQGNRQREHEVVEQMIDLMATDSRARSFRKYFDLLGDDIHVRLASVPLAKPVQSTEGVRAAPFTSGLQDVV